VSKHRDRAYRAGRSTNWIKDQEPDVAAMVRMEDGRGDIRRNPASDHRRDEARCCAASTSHRHSALVSGSRSGVNSQLAHAAYETIHVISKNRNRYRRTLIFDANMIKEEYRSDWNEKIMNSAIFFKHARNDPNGSIELPEGELNL
jgi:hypothetical protein